MYHKPRMNYCKKCSIQARENIAKALSVPGRLPRGKLQEIHDQSKVPIPTLKRWRTKLLNGISPFRRKPKYFARGLPKSVEHDIYAQVMERIRKGVYTPREWLKKTALQVGVPVRPDFKAGRKWMKGFLYRYGLSLRAPHLRRRTRPCDDVVANFIAEFEIARLQLPDKLIVNMDETAWRLFNGSLKTIDRRGSDEVVSATKLDARTCITVISAITMSGKKLPVWAIAKGVTVKCEERFRNNERLRSYIASGDLVITHSVNGWTTHDVAKCYLQWLSKYFHRSYIYLIWDLHASHRSSGIKKIAADERIVLSYVPAGQTGTWQPLDLKVFGALKQMARTSLDLECAERDLDTMEMSDALAILLSCWRDIAKPVLKSAWAPLIGDNPGENREASLAEPVDREEEDGEGSGEEDWVEEETKENPEEEDQDWDESDEEEDKEW